MKEQSSKDVKGLTGEELRMWFLFQPPLFTGSAELDGMSVCFANPDLVEEGPPVKSCTDRESPARTR